MQRRRDAQQIFSEYHDAVRQILRCAPSVFGKHKQSLIGYVFGRGIEDRTNRVHGLLNSDSWHTEAAFFDPNDRVFRYTVWFISAWKQNSEELTHDAF